MSETKHIPVIIGNYSPFRIVLRDGDEWNPTLEQINKIDYDYVKLNRMSTYIDIGINPFSLGISFDGSLILPATKELSTREAALDLFNKSLGILLLGGIYSEAIHPGDISFGSMTLDGYVKLHGGQGALTRFHKSIRYKLVSVSDAILLLSPQTITTKELETAYPKGKKIFDELPDLNPSLLLYGTSKFVRSEWAESLIFLWTSIEQVINIMWKKNLLDVKMETVIEGRTDFLKDYRTWTISSKIELLYQIKQISPSVYKLLNHARKTRNDFIHNAKTLSKKDVESALEGLFKLISLTINTDFDSNLLDNVIEMIYKNQIGDVIPKKRTFSKDEVTHWMSLPPLPGDSTWGDKEYEVIEDLLLKPL